MLNTNKHIKTGYTTPKDYFNSFDKKLEQKIILDTNKKKSGYQIPHKYFEFFEEELISKTLLTKQNKIISILANKKYYFISSAAAIIILSLFILNPRQNTNVSFDNIETVFIEEYLSNEEIDIPNTEITELLKIDLEDLDVISFLNIKEDKILEYIKEDANMENFNEINL
jgi:hypothetical protein